MPLPVPTPGRQFRVQQRRDQVTKRVYDVCERHELIYADSYRLQVPKRSGVVTYCLMLKPCTRGARGSWNPRGDFSVVLPGQRTNDFVRWLSVRSVTQNQGYRIRVKPKYVEFGPAARNCYICFRRNNFGPPGLVFFFAASSTLAVYMILKSFFHPIRNHSVPCHTFRHYYSYVVTFPVFHVSSR